MHVKGRSADIGAVENLFHGDRVVVLFPNQGRERRAQQRLRLLNPPIRPAYSRLVSRSSEAGKEIPDERRLFVRYRTDRP